MDIEQHHVKNASGAASSEKIEQGIPTVADNSDVEKFTEHDPNAPPALKRGLKSRHLQMIAIGECTKPSCILSFH
jgi:amino acid permease